MPSDMLRLVLDTNVLLALHCLLGHCRMPVGFKYAHIRNKDCLARTPYAPVRRFRFGILDLLKNVTPFNLDGGETIMLKSPQIFFPGGRYGHDNYP